MRSARFLTQEILRIYKSLPLGTHSSRILATFVNLCAFVGPGRSARRSVVQPEVPICAAPCKLRKNSQTDSTTAVCMIPGAWYSSATGRKTAVVSNIKR